MAIDHRTEALLKLAKWQAYFGTGNNLRETQVRTVFAQGPAPTVNWCDRCDAARVSINILPDVALPEIFDFYVGGKEQKLVTYEWKVHTRRKGPR